MMRLGHQKTTYVPAVPCVGFANLDVESGHILRHIWSVQSWRLASGVALLSLCQPYSPAQSG